MKTGQLVKSNEIVSWYHHVEPDVNSEENAGEKYPRNTIFRVMCEIGDESWQGWMWITPLQYPDRFIPLPCSNIENGILTPLSE